MRYLLDVLYVRLELSSPVPGFAERGSDLVCAIVAGLFRCCATLERRQKCSEVQTAQSDDVWWILEVQQGSETWRNVSVQALPARTTLRTCRWLTGMLA